MRDLLRFARSMGLWLSVLLVAIAPADAAIVAFGFDASLETGALAGTTFPGAGGYDSAGVTGVGQEFVTLTSLDFTLLGVEFTKADIRQGGQAILQNGVLSFFTAAFFPPPPLGSPVSDIAFGFGGPGIIGYVTPPQMFGSGVYALTAASVPEPPSAWAFALALLVPLLSSRRLSSRRRRENSTANPVSLTGDRGAKQHGHLRLSRAL